MQKERLSLLSDHFERISRLKSPIPLEMLPIELFEFPSLASAYELVFVSRASCFDLDLMLCLEMDLQSDN